MLLKSLFLCFLRVNGYMLCALYPWSTTYAPTVVKRLPSVQVAGADAGEIMTDTAEGHLGEKNLMSVATTGPLINAGGQWAERPPRKLVQGSRDKTAQKQFEF
jgi:hypothetical protein